MKKVTIIIGSARKKNTYHAVLQFMNHLKRMRNVDCELVKLSDYYLGICQGCFLCFEKGEELCPLKDDRDLLLEKITASDGVVFATPNYSFHCSGEMKVFLDRFGFAFHRPRYFGKVFTNIVTQGIGGGNKIVEYLDFVGSNLGFNTVKGVCVTALDPRTEKDQQKIDQAIARLSQRFYDKLNAPTHPVPGLFKLMLFRMARSTIQKMLDDRSSDYRYYRDQGWFESDYYYPTRLGALKQLAGRFFDSTANLTRSMLS